MTIEERANMAAKEMYGYVQNEYSCGYIQGATEQKAIDIDKVCEWLMQNWNMGQAYINAQGKLCYRCIDDLRKAMEE